MSIINFWYIMDVPSANVQVEDRGEKMPDYLHKQKKLRVLAQLISYVVSSLVLFAFSILNFCDNIFKIAIILICCICMFKCAHRMHFYSKKKLSVSYHAVRENYMRPEGIKREYRLYRLVILCIWILFSVVCAVTRFRCRYHYGFYVSAIYMLAALDILFYMRFCILNFFAGLISAKKRKNLSCCYTCPVRGWDMLMMTLPLLSVIDEMPLYLALVIIFTVLFSLILLINWEKVKFNFSYNKKNCAACNHGCGEEYNGKRVCIRGL